MRMSYCMRYYHSGNFEFRKGKTEYVGGGLMLDPGLDVDDINVVALMDKARKLVKTDSFEVWYRVRGRNLNNGRRKLVDERDIGLLLETKDMFNMLTVWVVVLHGDKGGALSPRTKNLMLKQFLTDYVVPSSSKQISYKKKKATINESPTPLRRSPRGHNSNSPHISHPNSSAFILTSTEPIPLQVIPDNVGTSARLPKLNVRRRLEIPVEEEETVDDFSSGSEGSDLEGNFEGYDEENVLEEELFQENDASEVPESVRISLENDRSRSFREDLRSEVNPNSEEPSTATVPSPNRGLYGVDNLDVRLGDEIEWDSDDFESLKGSGDEVDPNPRFNPEVDFKGKIVLKQGLIFPKVSDLRLALKQHAIENGYDFFYLHNGRKKLSIFCVNKCDCEWDFVRSKIKACTCNNPNKCLFRVYAVMTKGEDTMQIKGLELEHSCAFSSYTRQVTSEFLAAKYLEDWRITPSWKLKDFKARVYKDLLVEVSYSKLWRARARAKLMIHGNAAEEYARVYDYAEVIKKFNPGSSSYVVCEHVDRPIPTFQRMYICLEACKQGFVRGCRPIIGVDGCHLKGPYPGMCLVAVGKYGNNNIFPIAWAVVEVENTQTWRWFLVLLMNDVGRSNEEREGLTFISDRQKGLIEAFSSVTPKAAIRFCVRHICPNFKLHFAGMVFRDLFWKAAKSTTKHEFLSHMEAIKALKPEAYNYLADIPPESWSRHAFTYTARSNMLLNNLCETFNSVIKEVRDKSVLTQMEWMRRYVMQRTREKRQGVLKYGKVNMPYVNKYFEWAQVEIRKCLFFGSIVDKWEVEYKSVTHNVDLKERVCSYNHWQLTGIPCVHAYGCILKQRGNPQNYVDPYYSKSVYQLAYEPIISPMPGPTEWDKTNHAQPEPPAFRRLPVRPSEKKRRKEPDEGKGKKRQYVKRVKRPNKCGHCGQLGHNKSTCKNPPSAVQQKDKGGRPKSDSPWAVAVREKRDRRKAQQAGQPHQAVGSSNPTQTPCCSGPQTQQSQAR